MGLWLDVKVETQSRWNMIEMQRCVVVWTQRQKHNLAGVWRGHEKNRSGCRSRRDKVSSTDFRIGNGPNDVQKLKRPEQGTESEGRQTVVNRQGA